MTFWNGELRTAFEQDHPDKDEINAERCQFMAEQLGIYEEHSIS